MKNLILTICILVFWAVKINAQVSFQRTYGSPNTDEGNFVQQTSDNGYILAGSAIDFIGGSNQDAYLVKTDLTGAVLWSKTYGSTQNDYASCVKQTSDAGYIVSGTAYFSGSAYRGFLIKINSAGDTAWTKTYGSEDNSFTSVVQTNDGGYIASGNISDHSHTSSAGYLVKVDNNGNVLWAKKYNLGSASATLNCVLQANDGNYVACGNTGSNCIIKVNSAGDTIFCRSFGGSVTKSIKKTTDGGYIIGGGYSDGISHGNIIKTDANGIVEWNNTFGSSLVVNSVHQKSGGEYVAVLTPSSGIDAVYTIKLNTTGNFVWGKKYKPSNSALAKCMQPCNDGGFVIIGENATSNPNVYLVKTDSNGVTSCNNEVYIMSQSSLSASSSKLSNTITSDASYGAYPMFVNSVSSNISTLCITTGIDEKTSDRIFSIYPNPTSGKFTIQLPLTSAEIIITDFLGRQVMNMKTTQNNPEFQLMEDGVYIISVHTEQGSASCKLIVRH